MLNADTVEVLSCDTFPPIRPTERRVLFCAQARAELLLWLHRRRASPHISHSVYIIIVYLYYPKERAFPGWEKNKHWNKKIQEFQTDYIKNTRRIQIKTHLLLSDKV